MPEPNDREPLHLDDALEHLTDFLYSRPHKTHGVVDHNFQPHGYDLWLPELIRYHTSDLEMYARHDRVEWQAICRPFYDAAWELCRIGVLRPGRAAPYSQAGAAADFSGDGYSLTVFGRTWVKAAVERRQPPTDPIRFAEVIKLFVARFGPAFEQRAVEATRCYRTGNYLSCCVMAGAAAESILLATAVGKVGDEKSVLDGYRAAGGRDKTIRWVTGTVHGGLREQFATGCQLLNYWRDEAAHGSPTTISEVQAHFARGQLLRFAQLTEDNWEWLTARGAA